MRVFPSFLFLYWWIFDLVCIMITGGSWSTWLEIVKILHFRWLVPWCDNLISIFRPSKGHSFGAYSGFSYVTCSFLLDDCLNWWYPLVVFSLIACFVGNTACPKPGFKEEGRINKSILLFLYDIQWIRENVYINWYDFGNVLTLSGV